MECTYLGHASWLFECEDVRLLTDAVLGEHLHDGVFEVFPPRDVDLTGRNPTHIVITHRHPDHFDLPTLALLGERCPDAHVLTADGLVAESARALGFTRVDVVDERAVVDLGSIRLYTTPSLCSVVEWGLLLVAPGGTLWNMVDTVVRSPEDVHRILADAAAALGLPALGVDVALVRWCPLRQADAAICGNLGFPHEAYRSELLNAAAIRADTVVPGSCGDRYREWGAWQNRSVFPVTEERFLRDLSTLAPESRGVIPEVGCRYDLTDGLWVRSGVADWIDVRERSDDRLYSPFVLPEIVDPAPPGFDSEVALARIALWIGEVFVPALGGWAAAHVPDWPLSLVLELVFDDRIVALTFQVHGASVEVQVGADRHHDALDRVAGSVLLDVIEARSPWGRALMGGWLRSVRRACRIRADGRLEHAPLPAFLLYLARPYEVAFEEWVERWIRDFKGAERGVSEYAAT